MAGAITSGMDVAQVRQLAIAMKSAAEDISRIGTTITSKLNSTPWVGPDQKRFESDWNGHQRQQITQLATALNDASQKATKNAQEQEQASRT
jgi:hypothetical protein